MPRGTASPELPHPGVAPARDSGGTTAAQQRQAGTGLITPIHGILNLASPGQAVEIRVVVQRQIARPGAVRPRSSGSGQFSALPVAEEVDDPVPYLGYCLRAGAAELPDYTLP